jgi:ClpP class serine protease
MINNVKETLDKLGVTITDDKTGEYRPLEDILMDVANAFKEFKTKNKAETDESIIKNRESLIDDVCLSLAGGVGIRDKIKNKNQLKALLFKL